METQISFGIAFAAGILSFLSPCVLPLIPGYISFLSGVSLKDLKDGKHHKKVLLKAGWTSVFFVAGFSAVFIALGASASFVGKLLSDNIVIFTKIAGILIAILGVHMTGILSIGWLNYQKGFSVKNYSPGPVGAFLIGMAFGFGWTPCVGPLLAAILAIAATQETMAKGMALLFVYSLGLGIPFIATGFAVGAFMKFLEKYKKFIRAGEIITGILLVVIGILIFTGSFSVLLQFVPPVFNEFAK